MSDNQSLLLCVIKMGTVAVFSMYTSLANYSSTHSNVHSLIGRELFFKLLACDHAVAGIYVHSYRCDCITFMIMMSAVLYKVKR